ncbi:hypothetical protein SAY87_000084 [Trapa incisa]|uniref:phosphoglycerate mutase (2,3-diphosphoglycerate-dependent) n=1 Tax=Trapa incisa TaxID=236973 RepID=A0AAN7GLR6_9MYRT|nr:hypothetical protein SAY87_000084 [Trapa incisa]
MKGIEEAIEAGKRISNIPVDVIYTSALIRAQMTAMLDDCSKGNSGKFLMHQEHNCTDNESVI